MAELDFVIEFGMYGMHAKPLKGALWRARFYDREQGAFYAGSADCPFEAIAWALYEREERVATGTHSMTRSNVETPVQALARLRSRIEGEKATMDAMPTLKRYSYHLHGSLDFGLRVIKKRLLRGQPSWRPMAFVPPRPPAPPKAPKRPGWSAARRKTIERDGHCQKCRSTRGLEVHHKLERVHGGGDDLENLITLCDLCHSEWTWCQPGLMSFDAWLTVPPARMLVAAWSLPWPENKSAGEFKRELAAVIEAARIAHEARKT